jgi:hypothetical protein
MLTAMTNGDGWVTYLHLADLKAGSADDTMKKQVLANLSPADTLNSEQLVFLTRPALQKLKAALETSLAASSITGDEAAVRAALNLISIRASDFHLRMGKKCTCEGCREYSYSMAFSAKSIPGCVGGHPSGRE